jgi:hypothetical protein
MEPEACFQQLALFSTCSHIKLFRQIFLSIVHNSVCYITSIFLWHYSPCGPRPLFQFLNLYTVGRTYWTGDQPVARPLPTHRTPQSQNKRTQTSMLRVGFEPSIPVFEREKSVHALDRAAIVTGCCLMSQPLIIRAEREGFICERKLHLHQVQFIFIHDTLVPQPRRHSY